MSTSKRKSVYEFFGEVVDRMLTLQPVVSESPRMQNLAQKQAHIRAVGVREGFQAMRARSEKMTQRLSEFRQHRAHEESIDGPSEVEETIVLRSH